MMTSRKHVAPNRHSQYGPLFVLPAAVYFVLVFFLPLALAFWNSFHHISLIGYTSRWVGFAKFQKVITNPDFQHSARITLEYVLYNVPVLMFLSMVLAVVSVNLNRALFRFLSIVFFLPIVSSMVCAGIIWNWVLDPVMGVVNSALAAVRIPHENLTWLRSPDTALLSVVIIGIWFRVGFDYIIFTGGLLNIPNEYYEASDVDGASQLQKFFRITLPLLNPQVVMVLTLELIFAFRAFDHIIVVTKGGPANATKTVMVYVMEDLFRVDYGAANAVTVLFLLFLFGISYMQRVLLRRSADY